MARCRCTEIATYKYRVDKLNQNIAVIDQCKTDMESIRDSLEYICSHNKECYDVENLSAINDDIQNLQDELESEQEKLKLRINNKIQRLKADIADMEKEDERYHEEEDLEYGG